MNYKASNDIVKGCLKHYGMKGMKWGQHLISNANDKAKRASDDAKTAHKIANKIGNNKLSRAYTKAMDNKAAKRSKQVKITEKRVKSSEKSVNNYVKATKANTKAYVDRRKAYKNRSKMSTKQLNEMTNRINAENNLRNAINNSKPTPVSQYEKALTTAVVATAVGYTMGKGRKKK